MYLSTKRGAYANKGYTVLELDEIHKKMSLDQSTQQELNSQILTSRYMQNTRQGYAKSDESNA